MESPNKLKFTKTDEWVKVDENIATMGISNFAQEQLSDIVFIELIISKGDIVKKGDPFATIESVKAAADVNLPVSGEVIAINDTLPDTPELLNSDPYGKAWMAKIKLSEPSDLDLLMDDKQYQMYCAERNH
jgi:glycine cleavage system H protein